MSAAGSEAHSQYKLRVGVVGPVLSAGTATPAFGIDSPFQRASDGGRPLLPGTLIKGVVRQVLERAIDAGATAWSKGDLDEWFGDEATSIDDKRGPLAPKRAIVTIGDLVMACEPTSAIATRIAVDDFTGSVVDGALQVLELPVGIGETVGFEGPIRLATGTPAATCERICKAITSGLTFAGQLGSAKTAGFGRIASVETEPDETAAAFRVAAPPAAELLTADATVALQIEFLDPFLVSELAATDNFFLGRDVVPGGAIKGAFAAKLARLGLSAQFEHLLAEAVIRHAQPSLREATRRSAVLPLSLFEWSDQSGSEFNDALAIDQDELESMYFVSGDVSFLDNMKYETIERLRSDNVDRFGSERPMTRRAGRTRTAVSKEGIAESRRLFTGVAVDPGELVWRSEIHFPKTVRDDPGRADFLLHLHGGLDGIGKTKARAVVSISPFDPGTRPEFDAPSPGGNGRDWRVTVQTDALMHGPSVFEDGLAGAAALEASCLAYWRDAIAAWAETTGVALDVSGVAVRSMTAQKLACGYFSVRYPPIAGIYCPYLLTEPGSTFVVTAPSEAAGFFAEIALCGLPLPAGVVHDWRTCPFVPENGYGEVRVGFSAGLGVGSAA